MGNIIYALFSAFAQDTGNVNTSPDSGSMNTEKYNRLADIDPGTPSTDILFLSQKEFWLALTVLVCLILIIGFETWLIKTRNFTQDSSIKLIVITMVIMGSLFLIMSGYNDHIVAPAFGLFGTIAGYLFGRTEKNADNTKP